MADATPSAPDVGVYDAVELGSSAASAYMQQLPQDRLIESSIEGAVNKINESLDDGIKLVVPQNAFQEKLVDKINYENEISTIIKGYYIGDDFQQHGLEKINYDQLLEAASRANGITPERQEMIQSLRDNPNIDNLIKQVNEDGGLSQFILNGQGFLDHLKGTDVEIKNPNEFFNGHSTKPDFTGENIVMPDGSMPKAKLLNDDNKVDFDKLKKGVLTEDNYKKVNNQLDPKDSYVYSENTVREIENIAKQKEMMENNRNRGINNDYKLKPNF